MDSLAPFRLAPDLPINPGMRLEHLLPFRSARSLGRATLLGLPITLALGSTGADAVPTAPDNPFDRYLTTPIPPADGFDFPVGGPDGTDGYVDRASGAAYAGWRVALGFGETFSLGLHPPKGMYFVVDRHRGAFGGDWADYFGGHWLKINYPNPWDADLGLRRKRITEAKAEEIRIAWQKREATDTKTRLGGGIGFHGWIEDWDEDGPRHLSWGCIVMQNDDIAKLYDEIPNGAMVVIL